MNGGLPSGLAVDAPAWLVTGVDGEPPYYVRTDLAATPEDVPTYLGREWGLTPEDFEHDQMEPVSEIKRVWMTPDLRAPVVDDQEPWEVVDEGTEGAVAYWQWGW